MIQQIVLMVMVTPLVVGRSDREFLVGPSSWEGISPLRAVDLLTNREPREREAEQDYWGGSRKIEDQQIAHLTNTSESDEDRHKQDARPSRHHDELQSGHQRPLAD